MLFIDLENAYDMVPKQVPWSCLDKKNVPYDYIWIIKDM